MTTNIYKVLLVGATPDSSARMLHVWMSTGRLATTVDSAQAQFTRSNPCYLWSVAQIASAATAHDAQFGQRFIAEELKSSRYVTTHSRHHRLTRAPWATNEAVPAPRKEFIKE